MILNLFAGPGGWDEGIRMLGAGTAVGIELDASACATNTAAGGHVIRADITAFPVTQLAGKVTGLIGSPECTQFSAAGGQAGNAILAELTALITDLMAGHKTRAKHRNAMARALKAANWPPQKTRRSKYCRDYKTPVHLTRAQRSAAIRKAVLSASLVAEPARFLHACPPEWVALEQVPAVLPLWKVYAAELRKMGYSVWAGVLNSADYGVIAPCPLHATSCLDVNADCVGPISRYETALAIAGGLATTQPDAEGLSLAATVVGRSARAIRQAFAGAATCAARQQALVALAEGAVPTTPAGSAVGEWTSEVTSAFGLTAATAASIASLLSSYLDDLSPEEKLSITSTKTLRTIVQAISRSIAATLITGPGTGPASRTAGCGLCVDLSVPQTRQRAILVASRVRRVSRPEPTHYDARKGEQLFGRPWTSMASALGWGATGRAAPTVTAGGTATGGAEPFGHRDRDALQAAQDAGQWALRMDTQSKATLPRSADEPAPTMQFAHRSNLAQWVLRREVGASLAAGRRDHQLDEPAPTITGGGSAAGSGNGAGLRWVLNTNRGQEPDGTRQTVDPSTAPAPALTAKAGGQWHVKSFRNNNNNNNNNNACERSLDEPAGTLFFGGRSNWAAWQGETDSVRITVQEAAILQSFRPDYPWQGTKTAQYTQVGNAVPPLLAMHVLAEATGIAIPDTLREAS